MVLVYVSDVSLFHLLHNVQHVPIGFVKTACPSGKPTLHVSALRLSKVRSTLVFTPFHELLHSSLIPTVSKYLLSSYSVVGSMLCLDMQL